MPLRFTVYILRCSDGALYIGRARNLAARLTRHAEGRGCQFTRTRLPVTLVWSECHPSWESATTRESQIKSWTRAKKEALVRADIAELKRLSRGTHRRKSDGPAVPA
jgi:predicted GIY-YIG superfamily endonuclease